MSEIAVTGLGVATALGIGAAPTWRALCAGASGIRPLPVALGTGYATSSAAWIDRAAVPAAPSLAHGLALAAATEALADAGLASGRPDLALVIGNNVVELPAAAKRSLWRGARARAADAPPRAADAASEAAGVPAVPWRELGLGAWLCARLGLEGSTLTLASNCVAGLQAIIVGALRVASGRARAVVAGGVDAAVSAEMLARFSLLRALAPGADAARCRPFDRRHCGTALGDGAGFLVLEDAAAAVRRGARIRATIPGWGMSGDCHHVTRGAPDAQAKAAAISQALARAGVAPAALDLVSAHGTGTVDNDVTEIRALRRALGTRAEHVPITATKAALGHALGASAAIELGLAVLALETGRVPPVVGFTEAAPECAVQGFVRTCSTLAARTALKTAFAFGGLNACVVLRAVPAAADGGEPS